MPRVTAIVVVRELERAVATLAGLAESEPEGSFRAVFVDNGSADGTADLLAMLEGDVVVLRRAERTELPEAWNDAIVAAGPDADPVVLVMEGLVPQPGALTSLSNVLAEIPQVACVSGLVVGSDSLVRSAGADLLRREDRGPRPALVARGRLVGWPASHPDVGRAVVTHGAVPGLLALSGDALRAAGPRPFDERLDVASSLTDLLCALEAGGSIAVYDPAAVAVDPMPLSAVELPSGAIELAHRWREPPVSAVAIGPAGLPVESREPTTIDAALAARARGDEALANAFLVHAISDAPDRYEARVLLARAWLDGGQEAGADLLSAALAAGVARRFESRGADHLVSVARWLHVTGHVDEARVWFAEYDRRDRTSTGRPADRRYSLATVAEHCADHAQPYRLVRAARDVPMYTPRFHNHPGLERTVTARAPEQYVAELHDVTVIGECGSILTTDGRALNDLVARPRFEAIDLRERHVYAVTTTYAVDERVGHIAAARRRADPIDAAIFLLGPGSSSFSHFIYESISRLSTLDAVQDAGYADLPVLVDEVVLRDPSLVGALSACGVPRDRIIAVAADTEAHVNRLVVPSCPFVVPVHFREGVAPAFDDFVLTADGLEWLARRFRTPASSSSRRRLFLPRRAMPWPRLDDEATLDPVLAAHGFEMVEGHQLDFDAKRELFGAAEAVVGGAGTGFLNLLWAPFDCKVVAMDLLPAGADEWMIEMPLVSSIPALLGQPWTFVGGPLSRVPSASWQAAYTVAPEDLDATLNDMGL